MKNEFSKNFRFEISRIESLFQIFKFPIRHFLNYLSIKNLSSFQQMAIFSSDHISHDINLDGIYEKDYLLTLTNWLKEIHNDIFNGVAIDVGANIGNHSVFFSKFFKKVYSFEPNPTTFKLLEINSKLSNNIYVKKMGLSNKEVISNLLENKSNIGGSKLTNKKSEKTIDIKLTTLDQEINIIKEKINLLKIDVEGHEFEVIQGSKETITKFRPIIIFEQQLNDFPDNFRKIQKCLVDLNYNQFGVIKRKSNLPFLNKPWINKYIFRFLCLITKEFYSIEITESLDPAFYHFIIAIPDNFKY